MHSLVHGLPLFVKILEKYSIKYKYPITLTLAHEQCVCIKMCRCVFIACNVCRVTNFSSELTDKHKNRRYLCGYVNKTQERFLKGPYGLYLR